MGANGRNGFAARADAFNTVAGDEVRLLRCGAYGIASALAPLAGRSTAH
jgi:hypothetical protein